MSIHDYDDHYEQALREREAYGIDCRTCDRTRCICGEQERLRQEHEAEDAELDRRDRERASILAECRVFNLAYAVMKGWV